MLLLGVAKRPRNKWGQTPIMLAAQRGHITICEKLYSEEDSNERKDYDVLLKYIMAIPNERALALASRIEESFNGKTFSYVCNGGDKDYFKSALETIGVGVDDIADMHRRLGLYEAIKSGSYEQVKLLLDHAKEHGWITGSMESHELLYEAILYGRPSIVWLLLNNGMTCSVALHAAVRTNNKKLTKMFCKVFKSQLDYVDDYDRGKAPLSYALHYGYINLAQLLLKKGADPHKENKYGVRPLDFAVASNNATIILLLLKYNGNTNTIKQYVEKK